MSDTTTELAARMPWTTARPDTFWLVDGGDRNGTFSQCLARALPEFVTGTKSPVFELLLYGQTGRAVAASSITKARELLLVDAADPLEAFYERDQHTVDAAVRDFLEETIRAAKRNEADRG